ncbi:hypothetical protein N7495_006858 [Penicillium taxi]|uniref:uncharacterized protein n=1 Tax=Penicillium taxi TaxID=168475 RepID=UPI002544FDC2|nr:uncharacterized protein N7495_006858 [Penicillium taxi]KAJ5895167.1 hypothetical protein N7495_006858 [Penicillium taxi]
MKYSGVTFVGMMGCALAAPLYSETPTSSAGPAPTAAIILPGGFHFPPIAKNADKRGLDWFESLKDKFGGSSAASAIPEITIPTSVPTGIAGSSGLDSILDKLEGEKRGLDWSETLKDNIGSKTATPPLKFEGSHSGSATLPTGTVELGNDPSISILASAFAQFEHGHGSTIPTNVANLEHGPAFSAIASALVKPEGSHGSSDALLTAIAKSEHHTTAAAALPTGSA